MISRASKLVSSARPWVQAGVVLRDATAVGQRPRVYGRPIIENAGRLVIGDRLQLFSRVATTELATGPDGVLTIGSQVLLMDGTTISAMGPVRIGDNCLFGRHTQILDCAFHYVDPARRLEMPPAEAVEIGNNVWLASRVTVLPGVTIGDDAVVGAGSVVTSDVAPKTVVGGVPARKIRDL